MSMYCFYIYDKFGDTTVGVVKANDADEAKRILENTFLFIKRIVMTELKFDDKNICEIYYGG